MNNSNNNDKKKKKKKKRSNESNKKNTKTKNKNKENIVGRTTTLFLWFSRTSITSISCPAVFFSFPLSTLTYRQFHLFASLRPLPAMKLIHFLFEKGRSPDPRDLAGVHQGPKTSYLMCSSTTSTCSISRILTSA